jgi:hypothetical protein
MIKDAIATLVGGKSLSMDQAAAVMAEIMDGGVTPAQFGAFVTALRMKGETSEEIAGMARVMRDRAIQVHADGPVVETCGTGAVQPPFHRIREDGQRPIECRMYSRPIVRPENLLPVSQFLHKRIA